jgi:hypothetical protein
LSYFVFSFFFFFALDQLWQEVSLEVTLELTSFISMQRQTRPSVDAILRQEGVDDLEQRHRILDRIFGPEEKEPEPDMDKAPGISPNAQRPVEAEAGTAGVKRISSGLFGY